RQELEQLLKSLTTEGRRLADVDKAKRELRKRRMQESRQRRKETKLRRLRERQERAEAWRRRLGQEVLYLGEGVSGALNQTGVDRDKLGRLGLPVLTDAAQLAAAMGIRVGELRFLSFARRTSTVNHYRRFQIPKKTGGLRLISAPM